MSHSSTGNPEDVERLLSSPDDRPRLALDVADWERLLGWTRATDREVSGLGQLEIRDGKLRVSRLYLPPQVSNAIETELQPRGLATLMLDLVSSGSDPLSLRLWWHSHAREMPFWSGLDERTIESFAPAAMVSMVIDHRGGRLTRLDTFAPRRTHWVDVEFTSDEPGAAADPATLRDQVAHQVGDLAGSGRLTFRHGH